MRINKLKSILKMSKGKFKPSFNIAYITPVNEHDQTFTLLHISDLNLQRWIENELSLKNQKNNNIIFVNSINDKLSDSLKGIFNDVYCFRKSKEHNFIKLIEIDNHLENSISDSEIEEYILHSHCSKEDYILFKLIHENYVEEIAGNAPLPFGSIFYNSSTYEIYHSSSNEYTKDNDSPDRYKFHAETLGSKFMSSYGGDYKNLHCLTTYIPCRKCFNMMNSIVDKNSGKRLHKFMYLLDYYSEDNLPHYNKMRKNNKTKLHFDPIDMESNEFVKELICKSRKYIKVCKRLINTTNI